MATIDRSTFMGGSAALIAAANAVLADDRDNLALARKALDAGSEAPSAQVSVSAG